MNAAVMSRVVSTTENSIMIWDARRAIWQLLIIVEERPRALRPWRSGATEGNLSRAMHGNCGRKGETTQNMRLGQRLLRKRSKRQDNRKHILETLSKDLNDRAQWMGDKQLRK